MQTTYHKVKLLRKFENAFNIKRLDVEFESLVNVNMDELFTLN